MKNPKKRVISPVFYLFLLLAVLFLVSTGFFQWFKDYSAGITGEATKGFGVNITVGSGGGNPPNITQILNSSTNLGGALTEGPANTTFVVNFSVLDLDGISNLVDASAAVNFSRASETYRYNHSCARYQASGNQANYTCRVEMWWWDGSGAWLISANISDNNGNVGRNNTLSFSIAETIGFVSGPGNITFATLTAGATNQTASNDPIILNNTGNKDIVTSSISVNATTLAGETTSTLGLYSGNFSIGNTTGSSAECGITGTATQMNITSGGSFINITFAVMNASNYTISIGREGQEELYLCLLTVGSELTQQSYSTATNRAWTLQILTILGMLRKSISYLFMLIPIIFGVRMKRNIKDKKLNSIMKNKKTILMPLLAICLILFISFVSAFAVSIPSLPTDEEGNRLFYVEPGEEKTIGFVVQNGGGATSDLRVKISIIEGNEVADLVGKDTYTISAGGRIDTSAKITVSESALIGDVYPVAIGFATAPEGGGFSFGSAIQQRFKVVVGEEPTIEPKPEPVEEPELQPEIPIIKSKAGLVILIITALIILILIVYLIVRHRNKRRNIQYQSS